MRGIDEATRRRIERIITVLLAIALIIAALGVVYVAVTPGAREDPYTEFYILGPEGNASGYPTNLSVGETGEFIVGITNNEHEETTYTVALTFDDEPIETRTAIVADEETWEDEFVVAFDEPGEKRVRVLLFRDDEVGPLDDPYRELRLVVRVRE